jgi:Flp pilus assembly protein TadG
MFATKGDEGESMSICSRVRRPGEGGAAAVEFALVVPLLATLLLGIMQYGWYFYVANNTSAAAREGARHVIVGDCWGADFQTFVQNNAQGIDITQAQYDPDPSPDAVQIGDNVTVTVVADGNIIGFLPLPDTGDGEGMIRREFTARLEDKEAGACL